MSKTQGTPLLARLQLVGFRSVPGVTMPAMGGTVWSPPPFICSNLNPQDLRMWPDSEIGSLQTELVKMRSSGWVQTQCDWCPYECGHLDTAIVICKGTMPCKDWSCAAASQGTTSSWRKGCTWSFPGTFQGSMALITHFEPLELWDNTCLSFKPPSLKAFYHSSPSKQITPFQCVVLKI